MTITLPALDTEELERLSTLPTELAFQRAVPFLARLATRTAPSQTLAGK
jgi:hypothetical protein